MTSRTAFRRQLGWIGRITHTQHPRIVVIHQGHQTWRTACCDDGGDCAITGPAYATKLEALSQIDQLTAEWFGGQTS